MTVKCCSYYCCIFYCVLLNILLCVQGCHKSFSDWYTGHTVVYIAAVTVVISLQVNRIGLTDSTPVYRYY